jgi:hypothetical protein
LRSRSPRDHDTVITVSASEWDFPSVRAAVQEWTKEMDKSQFERGCIVEMWEYVFSLYMISGAGDCHQEDWCKSKLRQTENWLEEIM